LLSFCSMIAALLLGIGWVAWLRGPEAVSGEAVALLDRSARPELAWTALSRQVPTHLGSDLAEMARSFLGRVVRF